MGTFLSGSDEETRRFAKSLAKRGKFRIIGLTGELGVGKTTFTQGFAEGLRIKEKIISPTFVLIKHHPIPKSKKVLYHIDLYRLEEMKDIKQLGIEEIIKDPNNIIIIEWAEKIKNLLPKNTLKISFKVVDKNLRIVFFSDPLI